MRACRGLKLSAAGCTVSGVSRSAQRAHFYRVQCRPLPCGGVSRRVLAEHEKFYVSRRLQSCLVEEGMPLRRA